MDSLTRVNLILSNDTFKNILNSIEACEKKRIYCKHNLEHLLAVARLAYIYNLEHDLHLSKEIIYACALLHDIGRLEQYKNNVPHNIAGVKIAKQILSLCQFDNHEQELICKAISTHNTDSSNDTLSYVLYWADKKSRNCFSCQHTDTCKWNEEKRNYNINY